MKTINKDTTLNVFIGFTWLISVLSFLELIQIPIYVFLSILILAYFLIIIFRTNLFINLMVYLIILSPIFGAINIFQTNILFSDIFLFFSIIVLLLKKIYPSNTSFFYFVFFLLFIHIFLHLTIGNLINIKPLVSIIEIFAIYIVSKETLRRGKNETILFSILMSTSIGILLMFLAFFKGISLVNFEGDSKALIIDSNSLDMSKFRMTFFYTNFPFIISSLIFILIYFLGKEFFLKFKLILVFFILLVCLSLIASGNKTAMISTLIIFIFSNFIFSGTGFYRKINIFYLLIFIPIVFILIYKFFLNDFNSELFTTRMKSSDSFEDRIGVYVNVFHILSDNITRIFIGFGADFLTGAGEPSIANKFKVNYYTKDEQGAVDSGIVTFIIEFGIIYCSLLFYVLYKRVKMLFFNLSPLSILFLQVFFIFFISSTTQLVGLSKIFWFFVIIFAMSKYYHPLTKQFSNNINSIP
jgi:hypothetical protein